MGRIPMDHLARSSRNCFSAAFVDRVSEKRKDEKWVAERLQDPGTIYLPLWQSKNLFAKEGACRPLFLTANDLGDAMGTARSIILLGAREERVYFAVDLNPNDSNPPVNLSAIGQFRDLRSMSALIPHGEGALLAYARAMTYWHGRHRFCGDCGSPTRSSEGGHLLLCTNDRCRTPHFPRTDPAIIVLITFGKNCLLARQAGWPAGMYSTIAGFVEPGESLENAVVREVVEETGLLVRGVHYHSSQPWPFPGSIMLGFYAHAQEDRFRLQDRELEDALWLSREGMEEALRDGTIRLPPGISIAYRLIEDWFDDGVPGRLKGTLSSEKIGSIP